MKKFIRTTEWRNFVVKHIMQIRTSATKPISSRKLSQKLNKCESYINKIKTGQTLPSPEKLFEICEYFDNIPAEFFSDDNNTHEKNEPEELYFSLGSKKPHINYRFCKKLAWNNGEKQIKTVQ